MARLSNAEAIEHIEDLAAICERQIHQLKKMDPRRKSPTSKKAQPRKPLIVPRSDDLCKQLVTIAAFNFDGNEEGRMAIYKAVKTLQLMDRLADEYGLVVRP